jgi:CubicO group peptidase (beta-lactamase class C family)
VVHRGELVVDLWGGSRDPEGTEPWTADTITNVWSSTKTMAALCALMLVDRGELDVDAPVARYWPGFEAAGKEGVLVRHVMSHTAGLSGWAEPMALEDLCDWDKSTGILARQAPWWEPGTASGYHALTQGYLVGELVRRIDGRTIGRFFAEEVAGPLNADFHIGLPASEDHRVARVVPPTGDDARPGTGAPAGSVAERTFANPPLDASVSWTEAWRRAEVPAAGGHGNARSAATVQAVISHGGEHNGVRLLSPATIELIFREQCNGTDLVMLGPMRHGIGYGLANEILPLPPRACFWGGWGGSLVINDVDAQLTITYMMNRMLGGTTGDERGAKLVFAAYAAAAASSPAS